MKKSEPVQRPEHSGAVSDNELRPKDYVRLQHAGVADFARQGPHFEEACKPWLSVNIRQERSEMVAVDAI